jgi:hypothetical protein
MKRLKGKQNHEHQHPDHLGCPWGTSLWRRGRLLLAESTLARWPVRPESGLQFPRRWCRGWCARGWCQSFPGNWRNVAKDPLQSNGWHPQAMGRTAGSMWNRPRATGCRSFPERAGRSWKPSGGASTPDLRAGCRPEGDQ